jgi:catechol 2,3-dioxygenase-like lactoylglutathione lyase family enzyme
MDSGDRAPLSSDLRMHHVALRCPDLPRTVRFYETSLGLRRLREQPGHSVWLALGAGVLMLEQAGEGEPGVLVGSLDLLALPAQGVAIEAETAHTSYFRDPDGRRLAVSTYPLDEVL